MTTEKSSDDIFTDLAFTTIDFATAMLEPVLADLANGIGEVLELIDENKSFFINQDDYTLIEQMEAKFRLYKIYLDRLVTEMKNVED